LLGFLIWFGTGEDSNKRVVGNRASCVINGDKKMI